MTYLYDTNHAIAHLNGDPRLLPHLSNAQRAGDTFAVSTTVLGELYYGALASQRKTENVAKLEAFVSNLLLFHFEQLKPLNLGESRLSNARRGASCRPRMRKSQRSQDSTD